MNAPTLAATSTLAVLAAGLSCVLMSPRAPAKRGNALTENFLHRQALVFDQIDDFIFVVDLDNNIIDCNRRAAEMFGPAKADLIGRESWRLVDEPADKAKNRAAAAAHYASGTAYKRELWCRAADGRRRLIELTSVGLRDENDALIGHVTVGRDVTDRDAQESELRQAEKMKALGQISGGIAHDFNNLLGIIGGSVELAVDTIPEDSRGRKALDRALRATQMAADLVARLQVFSRQKPVVPRAGGIKAALEAALPKISRTMHGKVTIETRIPADLWPALFDAQQLDSVLLSLAGNADDAMPHGGTLSITAHNVSISPLDASAGGPDPGDYVAILVSDTGGGMSEAVKAHAFDPFFSTKPAGSGLGLTLVADFARQCGGHVEIDSAVGRGTVIHLLLPRAVETAAPAPGAAETVTAGTGKTVLVVEDEDELRAVTVDRVRALGYTALEAIDAGQALSILKSAGRIDLLLSDVILGSGMNGRELAETAVKLRPGLKAILVTGYAAAALQGEAPVPWKVLQKPIPTRALAVAIAETLRA